MSKTHTFISAVPHMVEQWDFDSNTDDIHTTSANLSDPRNWKCKKCGYTWSATPKARFKSSGKCPCCESNKVIKKGINDVLSIVPALADWYDFEKNQDIDIFSQGLDSAVMANWKCNECGREWQSKIKSRTKKVDGTYVVVECPHYNTTKRKAVELVSDIPKLLKYWDYDKNTLNPNTTPSNSENDAFWKCKSCGHEWHSSIRARMRASDKCPCCELNLVIRKGVNDLFTLVPDALDSYDFEKNINVDVYSLGIRSDAPLWWKCKDCSHEWQSSISSRIIGKAGSYSLRGCHQCYLSSLSQITPISAIPKLVKFWDFKKNSEIDVNLTSAYSDTSAWWKCKRCGYEWSANIRSRANASGSCPCCGANKAIHKGYNDILTRVPKLAEIYDFDKNTDLDIYSQGVTSEKMAYWKCHNCGHEWSSTLENRVYKEDDGNYRAVGCPICDNRAKRTMTYAEEYPELYEMFDEARNECMLASIGRTAPTTKDYWWLCKVCGGSFNSRIASIVTALNTSSKGCPYCSNTRPLPGASFADLHPELMDEYDSENTIDAFSVLPNCKTPVNWVCRNNKEHKWTASFALRNMGYGNCAVCTHSKPIRGINTFADVYPELVPYWSDNNNRHPDDVFFDSSLWFKWICPTCSSEYGAYIEDFVSEKESCPYCSNRKALRGINSLTDVCPDIAKYWSPNNDKDADSVFPYAKTWAKWICPDCTGEYNALVKDMTSGEASCPYCNNRLVLPGHNSFAAKHENLMTEWNFVNNYVLANADNISDNSTTKVWWTCPKNKEHKYIMSPKRKLMYQKRQRESCPYCKGLRRKKRHFV